MESDDKQDFPLDSNDKDQLSMTYTKASGTDFVKKLFQMLEENSYASIVRWSDTGDSFVITDTNEFTKEVLPRHFKHSNFASFVRQLNKYDFHKVKISNDLKMRYQIENIWEFKHPDFQQHNKESLENIKRKVPTKKEGESQSGTSTYVSINQFRNLQDSFDFLEKKNQSLADHVDKLQEDLSNLSNKYNTMVSSLLTSKSINESYSRSINVIGKCLAQLGVEVPPLDLPFMDQQQQQQQRVGQLQQPTTSAPIPPQQLSNHSKNNSVASISTTNPNTPPQLLTGTPLTVTTPQVQTQGQTQAQTQTQAQPQSLLQVPIIPQQQQQQQQELRILHRPEGSALHVLLVEDDDVCIQLCRKFLQKYGCTVEVVTDGLAAISVLEKVTFDLVLMDIVMPNLDGASATSVIRSFDKDTPIIAMTGNYQRQDLVTYLNHGMTDILAKPFTKDDLYLILEKHQMNKRLIYPLNDPYNPVNKLNRNNGTTTSNTSTSENGNGNNGTVGVEQVSTAVSAAGSVTGDGVVTTPVVSMGENLMKVKAEDTDEFAMSIKRQRLL